MKPTRLLLPLLLLAATAATAQVANINPVPQQVSGADSPLLPAPKAWAVVADKGRAASYALEALSQGSVQQNAAAKFRLTLGVKGDKAVRSVAKRIPAEAEGYYLSLTPTGATVAGADERGLYYGVQSLLQIVRDGQLQTCQLRDWPDVPFRGTVEGFYGTPWSHQARLRQIEFYGRNKMNVYIYGPKDDPYHRDHWRQPYPKDEAQKISELAATARQHGVNFYWAIHPGVDIKWIPEDRDALVAKFESMYQLGVRSFAVFFDDIWGEGTRADKQAELLNYVDDHFVKPHHDVAPLIMCPTEYNRAWANDEKGYLRTLGEKMNPSVQIMWTGNSVVHCIDKESMEWINQRIKRKAYIWLNFPVSDYVRDHVLLGPLYGNGTDIAPDVAGFVSNPMEYAEASKLSLYGLADYTWHMATYDPDRNYAKSLRDLLPAESGYLYQFAQHCQDPGPNGHGFRRAESENIEELQARINAQPSADDALQLQREGIALRQACNVLLTSKENPALVDELRPWLLQGKLVGEYCQTVGTLFLECGKANHNDFHEAYAEARALQTQMYELENSSVRHPMQPGIKVGQLRLVPTASTLLTKAVEHFNELNGTALPTTVEYQPYHLNSTVGQLAQLPVEVRGTDVSVRPALEVIKWQADGQLLIEAEKPFTLAGMEINLGVKGAAQHFRLEIFRGGEWKEVSLLHYSEGDPVIHTGNELGGMQGEKIRLTNKSGQEQEVFMRGFKFIVK